jgi:succinate dehydrogenase / fumarate reductase cytochrome b subunit
VIISRYTENNNLLRSCMKDKRPVYLNLLTMRFPVTAIASICHRASGVVNFLMIPFLICLLSCTLAGPAEFAQVQAVVHQPLVSALIWLALVAMTYHILAGIRHLVADFEVGESLAAARASAWFVFVLTALFALLEAYWLWS